MGNAFLFTVGSSGAGRRRTAAVVGEGVGGRRRKGLGLVASFDTRQIGHGPSAFRPSGMHQASERSAAAFLGSLTITRNCFDTPTDKWKGARWGPCCAYSQNIFGACRRANAGGPVSIRGRLKTRLTEPFPALPSEIVQLSAFADGMPLKNKLKIDPLAIRVTDSRH